MQLSWGMSVLTWYCFFFFNDTATTEIYTLSLHDALPISPLCLTVERDMRKTVEVEIAAELAVDARQQVDRKSTRLNSSHSQISYAVFCLKKKQYTRVQAPARCVSLRSRPVHRRRIHAGRC